MQILPLYETWVIAQLCDKEYNADILTKMSYDYSMDIYFKFHIYACHLHYNFEAFILSCCCACDMLCYKQLMF